MKVIWDTLIQRAEYLAARSETTKELIVFYAELLRAQKKIYEALRSRKDWLPTGILEEDLPVVRIMMRDLLHSVYENGTAALIEEAHTLLQADDDVIDEMLLTQWRSPSDVEFFAKALLQPYARWLADSGGQPVDRVFEHHESRCPFCGGRPQVSFLQVQESSSESGNRNLICSTCLTTWSFRRVVCANCGEEKPAKLGYFHSPEFNHVRIEACDTCKHYIKGIDLTVLGFAVPLVDEVAAASLDIWAHEHGYKKIELNMVGL